MPKSEQTIDRVVVVESLAEGVRSGWNLFEDVLAPFRAEHPELDFEVEYHAPVSRADFFGLLDRIAQETEARDGRPLLHLEIHGSEDGSGLLLANDDEMLWGEVTERLVAINVASHNNLVVVLAVCFGGRLARIFSESLRAPAFGLVGPNKAIKLRYLAPGFRAFYRELLSSGDGDRALAALNEDGEEDDPLCRYFWRSAEGAFRDHFRSYVRDTFGSAKSRQLQVEAAVTRARETLGSSAALSDIRKAAKTTRRKAVRRAFDSMSTQYLMIDKYPNERTRFKLRFEDCVDKDMA